MFNKKAPQEKKPVPVFPSKQWWIDNTISLAVAAFLVFSIRSTFLEAFKIPSGSMIPTLYIGDFIFVNKMAYQFNIPLTEYLFNHPITLFKRGEPKKGDIFVFLYPEDPSLHFIKRIVGTPGDIIELKNRNLYINGKALDLKPLTPEQIVSITNNLKDSKYSPLNITGYTENLNGVEHAIFHDSNQNREEHHTFGPFTVPPESVFAMGDNRDNSNDSRFWGIVPYENIRGKALMIWLSACIPALYQCDVEGWGSFHPERIGTLLK
jgi:signal peptidase I